MLLPLGGVLRGRVRRAEEVQAAERESWFCATVDDGRVALLASFNFVNNCKLSVNCFFLYVTNSRNSCGRIIELSVGVSLCGLS